MEFRPLVPTESNEITANLSKLPLDKHCTFKVYCPLTSVKIIFCVHMGHALFLPFERTWHNGYCMYIILQII